MSGTKSVYSKAGYLNENYRYFHLRDTAGQELDFHFHEFDKLVILLSGAVDYTVEGVTYSLAPGDLLIVRHHSIHKALIDVSVPYDRVIIYLNRSYFERLLPSAALNAMFERGSGSGRDLFSLDEESRGQLWGCLEECEKSLEEKDAWSGALQDASMIRLLAVLNRIVAATAPSEQTAKSYDDKIADTLSYINENPAADLSVEALAERVFLSRYYFMRLFSEQTGSSVHAYVNQRRLLYASHLIREGTPAARAASECGFGDYSAFHRAFKKAFGISPGQLKG